MIIEAGSSGAAEKRWHQKAPDRAAASLSDKLAGIATAITIRFNSSFTADDNPRVLLPGKDDAEFVDLFIRFNTSSWGNLDEAVVSAEAQIASAVIASGLLDRGDRIHVRQACRRLGISVVEVEAGRAPREAPLAEFHPDARKLLPDDLLLDDTDGHGPVGNDTGADVLGLYRAWRVDHGPEGRGEFFDQLAADWELRPLGELTKQAVAKALVDTRYELLTWDDAIVAWVVAQIACDGDIAPEAARLANLALSRQATQQVLDSRGWKSPADRLAAIETVTKAIDRASTA